MKGEHRVMPVFADADPGAAGYAPAALVGAAVTFALAPLVARLAVRLGVVDRPEARKMHSRPTPRLGGVAVLAGLVAGLLVRYGSPDWPRLVCLVAPFVIVFVAGLVDDVRGLRPCVRLAAEAGAAVLLMRAGYVIDSLWSPFGPSIELGQLAWPVTLAWFVGVANAFNLIDGLDGLLCSVGIASLAGCALVGLSVGDPAATAAAFSVAGALAGFLPWNWRRPFGASAKGGAPRQQILARLGSLRGCPEARPDSSPAPQGPSSLCFGARMFLGDSGSLLVGFAVAALSIRVSRYASGGLALHVLLALAAVPALETLLTLARRYVSGAGFFSPDRGHVHHVLISRKSMTVQRAVLVLAGTQVIFSGVAVFSRARLGWASLVPVVALLALAVGAARWLGYIEFSVLWRSALDRLRRRRRMELGALVGLARAGRIVAGAGTASDLRWRLRDAAREAGFTFVALEFTDRGAHTARETASLAECRNGAAAAYLLGQNGRPFWLFSGKQTGPAPSEVTFRLRLPADDGRFGRLVCHRYLAPAARPFSARDVGRYIGAPLAKALERIEGGGTAGGNA